LEPHLIKFLFLAKRLCKKEDHRPAKCEENGDQKDARKTIENEMAEAMIRSVSFITYACQYGILGRYFRTSNSAK